MRVQLFDYFTYAKLFRFALPSVVMMVFTSIYGVVDGFLYRILPGRRRLPPSIW